MIAAADGDDADLVVLNTCHIREKAAEKVYSDIGRLRSATTAAEPMIARRRLRRPGRRRGDRAPRADGRHRRRPAGLSPPARPGRARPRAASRALDTDMPALSKFGALPARRRQRPERLPDRAGRLRQILHLLRRALHARRRNQPALGGDRRRGAGAGRRAARARSPCSARTSMPGRRGRRGRGPRRPDPRARRDRRARTHPLHDQPSQRHDRRADRAPMARSTS